MVLTQQLEVLSGDTSKGKSLFSWHSRSNALATCSSKGKVMVYDSTSALEHQFSLPGVVGMAWDGVSDALALITESSGTVRLYGNKTKKVEELDSGMKDLCFLKWSANGLLLAVGTKKGSFVIFKRDTHKKIPVTGTHSRKIIDGAWVTEENRLLTIGADDQLVVSDANGSVLNSLQLRGTPVSMEVLSRASTQQSGKVCIAAINLGQTVQVLDVDTMETFTAQFKSGLGTITSLAWANGKSLLLGFSSGVVGYAELHGQELKLASQIQTFRGSVQCISYSPSNGFSAACGDSTLKVLNTIDTMVTEVKGESVNLRIDQDEVVNADWSFNGQRIALCTSNGNLFSYSLKIHSISTACGSLVFYLMSAREVGVKNIRDGKVLCTIPIDIDPAFIAAGMGVLAVGNGNKVLYYEFTLPVSPVVRINGPSQSGSSSPTKKERPSGQPPRLVNTVEYPSTVKAVRVCSRFAAVLLGGKIQLHPIHDSRADPLTLPPTGDTAVVAVAVSEVLLLYATTTRICVVALQTLQPVCEYLCRTGVMAAFPNPACTRVAYVDNNKSLFVFNPITEVASSAEGYEPDHTSFLWDQGDSTVFVTHNKANFVTFVCSPNSRHGATCESILVRDTNSDNLYTPLPLDLKPVSLYCGVVTCQSSAGLFDSINLRTHSEIGSRKPNMEAFYNNFSLNRLRWCSQNISSPQEAEDLAVKALHMLDIELAIRVYRQLSQPGLVMCLEKIKHIQEKNLLIGHVSLIMGYFKDAQTFFLRSSQPLCALQMRRDLMQWEAALALAADLAPDQVPIISMEYAQQLEYRGEYLKALEMYKNGTRELPEGLIGTELTAATEEVQKHNRLCQEGISRCSIRLGNTKEGVQIALASSRKEFAAECAKLLEEDSRYEEAAQLYEKAGDVEAAAALYIEKCKNLKAAGLLLPNIKSRNIIVLYARGKEQDGSFKEAEKAYSQAEDWDNVVRVKAEKLNDLHGAYVIVRKTRSVAAASLVATMCMQKGESGLAVEFFVLANSTAKAFELAKKENCMSNFEKALLSQIPLRDGIAPVQYQGDLTMVASYYENLNKPGQSALFYHIAGNFPMALTKYLEAGEPEDIEKAIEVVGKARSDGLTNRLIDFLMGETDKEPKDPAYIFKLYMSLGSFEKAAKTSIIIASKEQEMGNYRLAHKTLFEACRILRSKNMRVPNDLSRSLMLLHSYVIVKDLINALKDEHTACRMLLRVSRNIQKFSLHASTIVTSTVLQCVKSGFKKSAFELACFLIQNEKYRTELSDNNRKKIEGIVRRRSKDEMEDPVEDATPCPFCDAPVPETELDCGACKNMIPFCIVTGKHMVKTDFVACPSCHFPALYSAFSAYLYVTPKCPMCAAIVDSNHLQKIGDPDFKPFV